MKESSTTGKNQKEEKPLPAVDELDPAVRDSLLKRAEAEAAQFQVEELASHATNTNAKPGHREEDAVAKLKKGEDSVRTRSTESDDPHGTEGDMDTVVLDILTNRPDLEFAQLKKDKEVAITRDLKVKQANQDLLSQETSESREEELMEIVAEQASLAVAERLSAKEDLHKEKPSTASTQLMQLVVEITEASKLEKFANAANVHTNDNDVPSNAQNAALVTEQQDGVPEAVPQPALHRTTQMHPQSQPGAFMGAPGGQMQRNPNLNYGLLGASSGTDSGPEDSSVGTAVQILSNEGLVKADAVEDDTAHLMHANLVDLEAAQHRELQRKQQQTTFIAAILWLLLVAALIVGFVLRTQKNKEPEVVVLEATVAPTVYGSMEPSEVPSSAPTGALDMLLDTLPDYTLASINNGSETPQWRAWNWLGTHQNITFLPEWRKTQLFALATFFYSFEGDNWYKPVRDRWMDDTVEECDWFSSGFGYFWDGNYHDFQEQGITTIPSCNSQGQYISLYLQDLKLSGYSPSLPPEIALLTSLSQMFFSTLGSNAIAGPISSLLSTGLYELTALTELTLVGIGFTGNLPSEIFLLTNLEWFDLGYNELSGQIPSELGLMTSLDVLLLQWNQLSGPLPSEVGKLTALEWFDLEYNELSGQIPSELGLITSLGGLLLTENQLSGPVLSELGLLTSLTQLFLSRNQLSSPIPSELGLMASIKQLFLSHNLLTGQVPSEFGLLTALTELSLNQNGLTGQIASEFGQLTSLGALDLYGNQFASTLPTEIGIMTSLTSMALHNNSLTGTLPSQLNASMGLKLYGNQFSGTVPGHLCSFLWCDCSTNETPPVSTCANLKEAPPDWPGRFPSSSADVVLNIQTDNGPDQTSWVWQKETNVTGTWDTLESGGPLGIKNYLYSSLFSVSPNNSYNLIVWDSWGNGMSSGWIALTATNQTVLYSFEAPENLRLRFSEITIDVLVGADGSFDITNSTTF